MPCLRYKGSAIDLANAVAKAVAESTALTRTSLGGNREGSFCLAGKGLSDKDENKEQGRQ
jgi:hypothetical protein